MQKIQDSSFPFAEMRAVLTHDDWRGGVPCLLGCALTTRDYLLLERRLLEMEHGEAGRNPLLCRLIRSKLDSATLIPPGEIAPTMVVGGGRVTFRLDGATPATRRLVHWQREMVPHQTLPVCTLLGTTLLGMKAGQSAPLLHTGGSLGRVSVVEVSHDHWA